MKNFRVPASLLTFAALSLLAACGGGGGSGGGGGFTPPNSTPTPTVTATPTPTPTPGIGVSSQDIKAEENFVNGNQSWYTSGISSWSNNSGDTATAPTGTTDGTSCTPTQEPAASQTTFSQHAFVGIMFNGTEEALPQALGMQGQQPPTTPYTGNPAGHPNNNYPVEVETCEYNVHTHDYSGLVHIEDVNVVQSNTTMPSYATLQTLLDLWGAQLSATGLTAGSNTLSGAVTIYTGTPSGKDSGNNDLVNSYTPYTGTAANLQFSKHMAVWIVIGTPPAVGLPQVSLVISN